MKPTTLLQRVYKYCESHWQDGRNAVVKHFLTENVSKTTMYRLIKRWENGLPPERKAGSGRKPVIMTKKNVKRLAEFINDQTGISTRQLGKKFKCTHAHIVKTIQTKTNIKFRKRISIPERSDKQKAAIRPRCSRIMKKFRGRNFIMDDESYFTFKNSDKNANAGFWTQDSEQTPDEVKHKTKQKFQKKLLVWLAISRNGISQPLIIPSGVAVNQQIYLNQCIRKRLIPFIQEYHSDGNYVFWPDLASSHYAKSVVDHLRQENIFVEKSDNPPCVPELRPIEHFWSILKGLVYEKGWEAKTEEQLKNRIRYCLSKVEFSVIQSMVEGVGRKVDMVRRTGEIK